MLDTLDGCGRINLFPGCFLHAPWTGYDSRYLLYNTIMRNPFRKRKRRIGLALGGGGAKGLSHIAFLRVFDELGIRPNVISGTSIGALIGALYCSGMDADEIEDRIARLKRVEMGKLVDLSLVRKYGLVRGTKLITFIRKLIDDREFSDLEIPLKIVTTDFWSRSQVVLDTGRVADAVRASIAIAGIMEPVVYRNRVLVDGGAVNPVPYDIIQKECDVTVAVDVFGQKVPRKELHGRPNVFEAIFTSYQIMEASIVDGKMAMGKPDIYIKPELTNFRVLEFYRAREIIKSVQGDANYLKERLAEII